MTPMTSLEDITRFFFGLRSVGKNNTRGNKTRENSDISPVSTVGHLCDVRDTCRSCSLKARKRQREEAESGGVGGASVISVDIIGGGASGSSSTAAGRAELINERIGYKPHPKPATLPTLFGSLQF
ncbi:hypothetical protein F7725_014875 [Dissostichus mawsoni]|uniref:Uncharacterized protein n=1 Tax=Dissostichus mawsoni TaxID=36200 RepID=A0A7J5YI01_DISMA|nr:hypothetical protein F7725_014875 [Dissostichus mawsoni]